LKSRSISAALRKYEISSRLHIGALRGENEPINRQMKILSSALASRRVVQDSIHQISKLLLKRFSPVVPVEDVVLVPVLRAGLAMWTALNLHLGSPHTEFVICRKQKGTDKVRINWLQPVSFYEGHVVILDPIIATGDTIVSLCGQIQRRNKKLRSITVLACYASPSGIRKVLEEVENSVIVVGCVSKRVLSSGFLFPATGGDMGDKLFRRPDCLCCGNAPPRHLWVQTSGPERGSRNRN
jgi:4a-hydroxytetrahydrobiopterin dehydratase